MPGRSFRIARIAGIPIAVSPLWLAVVALITWSLGADYYPGEVHGIGVAMSYGLGLASALLLFASILAHEIGHALVARNRGIEVAEIDLWLLGGVSQMRGEPGSATDELAFALAGPAVTGVVAAVFGVLALTLPTSTPAALSALIVYQAQVNVAILVFNLLPAFPLDGGRVARALLWWRRGDIVSATDTAAGLGRLLGWLMVTLGVLWALEGEPLGLWLALIGGFVVFAAGAERVHEQVVSALSKVSVAQLMSHPAITIPEQLPLSQVQWYFSHYRHSAFPVTGADGQVIGILSAEQLQRAPRSRANAITAGQLAQRDADLLVDEHEDVARLLQRPGFARVGHAAVVDGEGRAVGVLSRADIERAVRASRLGGGDFLQPHSR